MNPDEIGRIVSCIVRRVSSECSNYDLDREDMFSYGMLIICEKINEWNPKGRAKLSTYLYTQVYGNMRNYVCRKVIPPINKQLPIDRADGIGQEDENRETRITLNQIEEMLDGRIKEVFILCREGYSYREVGAKLGISHQAVGKYIERVKKMVVDG